MITNVSEQNTNKTANKEEEIKLHTDRPIFSYESLESRQMKEILNHNTDNQTDRLESTSSC
jgi:hypothetical protein